MATRPWTRKLAAGKPGTHRKAPARRRLTLEALEDRVTPATYYVTNSLDDLNPGSLRWAITQANANPGADTIDNHERFGSIIVPHSIKLTLNGTQLPEITGGLTINGHRDFVVSGNNLSRVLSISPGANVNLSGVTVKDGDAKNAKFGGGIYNLGTLSIADSSISGNSADLGGGIYNRGTLSVANSSISGNRAGVRLNEGNVGGAPATITIAQGGGVYSLDGTVTLDHVTLEGNAAVGGNGTNGGDGFAGEGGGLYVSGGLSVVDSTIRGNTAQGGNGGVGTAGTPGTPANPFVVGSSGGNGGTGGGGGAGGGAAGGGVYVIATGQNVVLFRTTISDNAAVGGEGGRGGAGGFGASGNRGHDARPDPSSGSYIGTPATGGGNGGNGGEGGIGGNGGFALGGGIHVPDGRLTVSNTTVANNRAAAGVAGAGGAGGYGGDGGPGGSSAIGTLDLLFVPGGTGGAGGNGGTGGRGGIGGASRGGGLDRAAGAVFGLNATVAYNLVAGGASGAAGAGGEAGTGGRGGANHLAVNNPPGNPINAPNGSNGIGGSAGSAGPAGAASGGGVSAGDLDELSDHLFLVNTVVALNTSVAGTASDVSGSVDPSSRNNLIGTGGAGGLTQGVIGNLVGVADPRLGALADNGGPTRTVALLRGSPAIEAGNSTLAYNPFTLAPLTTDQRGAGFARTVALRIDIGAYESPFGKESLVVTTLADESDVNSSPALGSGTSLREAIEWANLNPGPDTITFDPNLINEVITLGGTQLPVITENLILQGLGATALSISGNGASRVLEVAEGADVTLVGVSILNGRALDGGGISNHGNLLLVDVLLSNNYASRDGGGIHNAGTLRAINSAFSGNYAFRTGGGIRNDGASVSLTRCIISANDARMNGGGIDSEAQSATVTVNACTFSGNVNNGMVFFYGTLKVSNSTFSGNNQEGISLGHNATATITGSTFFGNSGGEGGGIRNFATLTVSNSTISGNTGTYGGGILNLGSLTLTNTIVAGNNSPNSKDVYGGVGANSAYTLIGDANSAGGLVHGANGNVVGVDPKLGPLADNGGPTKTMALLPGSPALNAGGNALIPAGVTTDQRGSGFARVSGGGTVDIGAFEVQDEPPTISRAVDAVTANEGAAVTNFGGFNDPQGRDTVTVTASVGAVTKDDTAGTWAWSYTPVNDRGAPTSVTITATDALGQVASTTFGLTVRNVPPTITQFSAPATAAEGASVTLSAAATDPGVEDVLGFEWLVLAPDGSSARYPGATVNIVLPDDGTYDIYALVGDGDNILGLPGDARQARLVVTNVAPYISLGGAAGVNAGDTYVLQLGPVADPGADAVTQYVVHWGDGTSDTYAAAGYKTHVYATGGVIRAITVDLIDEDGTHTDRAPALNVLVNAAPTDIALSNASVAENRPAGTVVGTFSTTDPGPGIGGHAYALVGGPGDADNGSFTIDVDGNLKTAAGFDFEAKASYTIRVRSTDYGFMSVEKVFTISVTDVVDAPTLRLPSAQTAFEDVDMAVGGISVAGQAGRTLAVTLRVGHGTLSLTTTAGLTVAGNGGASVTLTGSAANLNAALATLVYRGALNYGGADSLRVTASDGALSTSGAVAITVKSAAEQAADLRARVDALRAAGRLSQQQADALGASLALSGHSGDIVRVAGFLAQVGSLRLAGVLTQAEADALLTPGGVLQISVTRGAVPGPRPGGNR